MTEKETILNKKVSGSTPREASGVQAQPFNRTEQKNCHVCKEHSLGIVRESVITPKHECTKQRLTKISGILTSNLRRRKSTDISYMAFFRSTKSQKHSLEECEAQKCKDCEIPVVFRIKKYPILTAEDYDQLWLKPNLKKGEKVILEGEFAQSKDSNRPSFTCYSYQLVSHE